MTEKATLSREQVSVLRMTAHRQLSRWSKKWSLTPAQHTRRQHLIHTVQVLDDEAFSPGCEILPRGQGSEPQGTR